MPVWVRGEERAEVVSPFPQPLRLTALGNSGATPAAGLTAPIAYFPTFGDLARAADGSLKGKIAFVSHAMEPTQDGSSYGAYGVARFVGPAVAAKKIGRGSCRERVCQVVEISGVAGSLKKKKINSRPRRVKLEI